MREVCIGRVWAFASTVVSALIYGGRPFLARSKNEPKRSRLGEIRPTLLDRLTRCRHVEFLRGRQGSIPWGRWVRQHGQWFHRIRSLFSSFALASLPSCRRENKRDVFVRRLPPPLVG